MYGRAVQVRHHAAVAHEFGLREVAQRVECGSSNACSSMGLPGYAGTERRSCPHPTMPGSLPAAPVAAGFSSMARTQIIDEELNAVAAHLRQQRPAILQAACGG